MSEQGTTNQQTGMDKFYAFLRGLGIRRRTDDKWIAGVCSGLADRLGIDPVIVRAALVVLVLLGGAGITIYLLAWALLPNDRDEIVLQRALGEGHGGSLVLVVIAGLALLSGSWFAGPWWSDNHGWGFPWGLAVTGLLIWWLVKRSGHHRGPNQGVSYHPSGSGFTESPPTTPESAQYGSTPSDSAPYGSAPLGSTPSGSAPYSAASSGSAPYSAAPSGSAPTAFLPSPGASGPARRTARPPVPRKPRRRSGGLLTALLAVGLALATYGCLVWAGDTFGWTGDHQTIAMAGSLAALGLLLVALGLAGWRAGFVAFLAVVLALGTWASTVVPPGIDVGGRVGDAMWAPTSAAAGANPGGFRLGVGDGVLDLSKLTPAGLSTTTLAPTLPAYVGLGDLEVLVPSGLNVEVRGHVGLGEIVQPGQAEGDGSGGSDISRTILVGTGPADVIVNAGVGMGSITVVKE
jgi:phage shock protein PspC (stress-responsive transcriptional regulator)